MDKNNFTLISHQDERDQIFQQMVEEQIDVACKGAHEDAQFIRMVLFEGDHKKIIGVPKLNKKMKDEKDCLISFMVNAKKYYTKADIQSDGFKVILHFNAPLYLLQRRQTYRAPVPEGVETSVKIRKYNQTNVNWLGEIVDISSGGSKLLLPNFKAISQINLKVELKINDKLEGFLVFSGKPPLNVNMAIRDVILENEDTKDRFIRVQFENLDASTESKLFSIAMELSKHTFRRG